MAPRHNPPTPEILGRSKDRLRISTFFGLQTKKNLHLKVRRANQRVLQRELLSSSFDKKDYRLFDSFHCGRNDSGLATVPL